MLFRSEAIKLKRSVFVDATTGTVDVPVYDRLQTKARNEIIGPCLIEEPTATTFVQPAWRGRVDSMGNIILRHEKDTGAKPAAEKNPGV